MINKIYNRLNSLRGKKVTIKINNLRNRTELLKCKILDLYPRIFTVESENKVRSFSYSDVLMGNIEIINEIC